MIDPMREKVVTFKCNEEELAALKRYAKVLGKNVSQTIRHLIQTFMMGGKKGAK